jgi:hypothetical protein
MLRIDVEVERGSCRRRLREGKVTGRGDTGKAAKDRVLGENVGQPGRRRKRFYERNKKT